MVASINKNWGRYTPWGTAQQTLEVAPGILFHSTAGHGGIEIDEEHQSKIPPNIQNFLNSKRYWEEDCDWAIPYYLFRGEIKRAGNLSEKDLKIAIETIKIWHPEFEAF